MKQRKKAKAPPKRSTRKDMVRDVRRAAIGHRAGEMALQVLVDRCTKEIEGIELNKLSGWQRDYAMGKMHALQELQNAIEHARHAVMLAATYGIPRVTAANGNREAVQRVG